MEVAKIIEFEVTPPYRDRNFLEQKYTKEGYSAKEISRLISSSRSVVMKYLREFQIPVRATEAKNKSQIGYGESWKGRQVKRNVRESAMIAKMRSLRLSGLSYWKIADVLNAWGIPTKTKKGKWSAKQVHQILRRVQTGVNVSQAANFLEGGGDGYGDQKNDSEDFCDAMEVTP